LNTSLGRKLTLISAPPGFGKTTLLREWISQMSACQSSAAASQAAVMYRGGSQRTGLYDTQAVAAFTGVKWKFETGDEVWSSPVLAEGVIYFGSDDDHLYALDAQTGQEKWRFKTGGDVRSSPAIADGIVYVESYDGNLYALEAQTGQEVRNFKTKRPIYSTPAIANGVVYVGSLDGNLYALN
jgi:hypothetical protein